MILINYACRGSFQLGTFGWSIAQLCILLQDQTVLTPEVHFTLVLALLDEDNQLG